MIWLNNKINNNNNDRENLSNEIYTISLPLIQIYICIHRNSTNKQVFV